MAFQHKKKYGQNFLNDEFAILNRIMEVAHLSKEENVLEIGPGQGALTALLLEQAKSVTCIEIDKDLEKILQKKFSSRSHFHLVMGDVLEVNFSEHLKGPTKVVANIPYYITSPIINKIMEHRSWIEEAFLMVQKEVGERICALTGRERSVLTLAVQYYGEAKYLFTIPREHFQPVPNVDSAFIQIRLYRENPYEKQVGEELFFHYIKAAFSNKRKNIINNFATLGYGKDFVKEVVNEVGISETERAENISIEDFIRLILCFEKKKGQEENETEL